MEPLFLRPKDAFRVIGVKSTKGYELINSGDLQTFKLGRATLIPTESVKAFVAKIMNPTE